MTSTAVLYMTKHTNLAAIRAPNIIMNTVNWTCNAALCLLEEMLHI